MSSGRAEHHVAEEAALEQAGARRDVGRLIDLAAPVHVLPDCHAVSHADDQVEALEEAEAQLADVGFDAGDHEGKAGFLGSSLSQSKGLGLAEGRAAYHGAAREIDDLVGVRIHDGDAAHAAEHKAFQHQIADGASAYHQDALVVESVHGVIEALGQLFGLAAGVMRDSSVLNGLRALRAGICIGDELLADGGVHIAAARDGDAAVVAEVELIVFETEEPAALTGGSDDI